MKFIHWGVIDYLQAWQQQQTLFDQIIELKKTDSDTQHIETVFTCEHPHVYTLGRHGNANNLLINNDFLKKIGAIFYQIDRGGDITYHGPGQLVVYPILDLDQHAISLKEYIYLIEEAVIKTLRHYGIEGCRLKGATGVWLDAETVQARKICAIGVRASRFVTMHGLALNINPDLAYFNYINPCGFVNKGVTSITKELGKEPSFSEVMEVFKRNFVELITNYRRGKRAKTFF